MEVNVTLETFRDVEFTPKGLVERIFRGGSLRVKEVIEEMEKIYEALSFREEELLRLYRDGESSTLYGNREEITAVVSTLSSSSLSPSSLSFLLLSKESAMLHKHRKFITIVSSLHSDQRMVREMISDYDQLLVLSECLSLLNTHEVRKMLDKEVSKKVDGYAEEIEKKALEEYRHSPTSSLSILSSLGKDSMSIDLFISNITIPIPSISLTHNDIEIFRAVVNHSLDGYYNTLLATASGLIELSARLFSTNITNSIINTIYSNNIVPLISMVAEITDPFLMLQYFSLLNNKNIFLLQSLSVHKKFSVITHSNSSLMATKEHEVLSFLGGGDLRKRRYTINHKMINYSTPTELLFVLFAVFTKCMERYITFYPADTVNKLVEKQFDILLALFGNDSCNPSEIIKLFLYTNRLYNYTLYIPSRHRDIVNTHFKSFTSTINSKAAAAINAGIQKDKQGLAKAVEQLNHTSTLSIIGSDKYSLHRLSILYGILHSRITAAGTEEVKKLSLFIKEINKRIAKYNCSDINNKFELLLNISKLLLIDDKYTDEYISNTNLSVLSEDKIKYYLGLRPS